MDAQTHTFLNIGVDVDLTKCNDPHTVAGLLKLYFRELPEPLLTFDLYDDFIESHTGSDYQDKINKVAALIQQLPVENQILLKYLCSHLSRVASYR